MSRTTSVHFTFPFPQDWVPSTVQVTGVFDDWQKSNTGFLTKNERNRQFEGAISIDLDRLQEIAQEKKQRKLVYKFVLDGQNWVTDPSQETEWDFSGNLNSVRLVDDVPLNKTSKTAADRKKDQHHQQQQCRNRAATGNDSTATDAFDHVMSSASASASMESVTSTASVICDPSTTPSVKSAAAPPSTLDDSRKTQPTSNTSPAHTHSRKNSGRKKKGKGSGF